MKKVQENQKNIIMLIDDLDNVEKEGPAISYISESEDSRIIVIDSTYFNENKLTTDTNWKTSDDLSFIINKGEYQFKIQNGNIESDIQIQTIGLM